MPLQEDGERLTVTFGLTIDDVVASNMFHLSKSPQIKRQYRIAPVIVLLPLALVFLAIYFTDESFDTRSLIIWLILLSPVVLLLFRSRSKGTMRKSVLSLLTESDNPNLLGRRVFTISPDGIREQWPYGEHRYTWSGVVRIETGEERAFFYVGSSEVQIVPRRAFASAEEFDHFVATARRFHESAPQPTAPPSDIPLAAPVDDGLPQ